jgi:hypothetical protein
MSAPLRSFEVLFQDVETGTMTVRARDAAHAEAVAWASFRGIGDLDTRDNVTTIIGVTPADGEDMQ